MVSLVVMVFVFTYNINSDIIITHAVGGAVAGAVPWWCLVHSGGLELWWSKYFRFASVCIALDI